MASKTTQALVGRRARFQRKTDYRIFSGWVIDMNSRLASVRSSPDVMVRHGDEFRFEVVGAAYVSVFEATLKSGVDLGILADAPSLEEYNARKRVLAAADLELEFEIVSPIVQAPLNESPRMSVYGAHGSFATETEIYVITLADVSENGMGALSGTKIPRGCVGVVTLETPSGELTCFAQTQYCRTDATLPNLYRVGFKVTEMNRVDRARWRTLVA